MSESALSPEKLLTRLEWTVLRRLDGLLQGDYRTFFRGFGLDLADIREYQYLDDVRYIDWNVTARLDTPYVRQYNEDRELTAWFLLDLTPSIDFGSTGVRKRNMLMEFTAVMARAFTRHGNRVGAIMYSGTEDQVIPARGGRRHVLHLLDFLMKRPELPASPPTDLTDLLRTALQVINRRSLIFIISDFFSTPGWADLLIQLTLRNEVLGVRLFDPMEMELPDLGMIVMQDAETGEQLHVDTHDRGFRRRFARAAEKHEDEVRAGLRQAGVDTMELSTKDDLVDSILRFAQLRKQRSLVASGNMQVKIGGRHDLPVG